MFAARISALTSMLVAAIGSMTAAARPIRVQGVVLAPTGEPVGTARIEVDGQEPVATDENGLFQISLPPDEWELRVSHPAYRLLRYRVNVAAQSLRSNPPSRSRERTLRSA